MGNYSTIFSKKSYQFTENKEMEAMESHDSSNVMKGHSAFKNHGEAMENHGNLQEINGSYGEP